MQNLPIMMISDVEGKYPNKWNFKRCGRVVTTPDRTH